jgi:hypothetical protein
VAFFFSFRQEARPSRLPVPAAGKRATVLIFVTTDCPIANRYAPEIARLCHEFTPRGVTFYAVYVDPATTPEQMRRHARAFGIPCPTLLDARHHLVGWAGATVTPEAAVFAPDGRRRYRGRIDDRYPRLGQRREQVTKQDLRDALNAVLAGKPVPAPTTEAIGCFIRDLK